MSGIRKMGALLLLSFLFFTPAWLYAADELYDAPGFDPNRETLSSMPNEHIDPFTGGLTLSFVDIRLPGNGGLDLVVQRTFNSKNTCNEWTGLPSGIWTCSKDDENTWLGFGWTLHFGRLFFSNNVNTPHVIEMPDGSRHAAYHNSGGPGYITKDFWLLDAGSAIPTLTLTNGTKIYYGQTGLVHPDFPKHFPRYATEIQDANGNEINIFYKSFGSGEIDYVIDSLGRKIEFTTNLINGVSRLVSITGPGVSMTYIHKPHTTLLRTFLSEARPPVGQPWKYAYNVSTYDLTGLTTPSGGVIQYTYNISEIKTSISFYYWTVVKKETSGRLPAGTWTFAYSQGTSKDYTLSNDPCGRVIKYTYYGYGSGLPAGSMWKLGLPKSKEVVGQETTVYEWDKSASISFDDYFVPYVGHDDSVFVPLMTKTSVTRDGKTYVTAYSNYDPYGNPGEVSETGDKKRNQSKTYWYQKSKNIVQNKPAFETVSGDFPGSFTTTYEYDSDGNLLHVNRYGVKADYAYDLDGNLRSWTDANGHTTNYQWTNGRISKITNPLYSISRTINGNGTVASETNGRGYKTAFSYDGNLRLTKVVPPIGNPTTYTYPADNSYKKEKRGNYYTTYYFDGYGRQTSTVDIKGITTRTVYKTCDLKESTGTNIGDRIQYDNFGRVQNITHKDTTQITYAYSQSNVTITDEAGNMNHYAYIAYGNPDEKVLVSVQDPLGSRTNYEYNILGNLLRITQGTITRNFTYDSRNFLTSESHPDRGTMNYTRDNIGNIKTKTDSLGTVIYDYDSLNRLISVNDGSGGITYGYDNANNRKSMVSSAASVSYQSDDLNRLTQKEMTLIGRSYTTTYKYDGNDNITQIQYPSGRVVNYTYNSKNEVKMVKATEGVVKSIVYFTTGTAIGLPKTVTLANGVVTKITYNQRNQATSMDAGASVLHRDYAYDSRGNMTAARNVQDSTRDQTFSYDKLNRLTGFNGPWGTGSYQLDAIGNRRVETIGTAVVNYIYENNRLTSAGMEFQYNGSGDAISIKEDGFEYDLQYDALHNLLSFQQRGGASLASFSYDGDGLRVKKVSGGKTIIYHYDKGGQKISENDGSGAHIADYIYVHGKLVARLDWNGRAFYHTDPVGTPLVMTDNSGTVIWRAEYRPFGEEQEVTLEPENNLMLVGKEKDKETGLYYFGARYMESMIGRFLSPDPLGPVDAKTGKAVEKIILKPQGLNVYAYALNNPYKFMDPSGGIWVTVDSREHGANIFYRLLGSGAKTIGSEKGELPNKSGGWGLLTHVPGSDPAEHLGVKRDLIQKWERDPDNPARDKAYPIESLRVIEQTWIEQINDPRYSLTKDPSAPTFFRWDPLVADRTYEDFSRAGIYNILYPMKDGRPWSVVPGALPSIQEIKNRYNLK